MRLRNINIIVCDCGVELNPEITTAKDYIKYNADTKIASCSKCGESGKLEFPVPPEPPVYIDPVADLDATVTDLVQVLVDKGVLY